MLFSWETHSFEPRFQNYPLDREFFSTETCTPGPAQYLEQNRHSSIWECRHRASRIPSGTTEDTQIDWTDMRVFQKIHGKIELHGRFILVPKCVESMRKLFLIHISTNFLRTPEFKKRCSLLLLLLLWMRMRVCWFTAIAPGPRSVSSTSWALEKCLLDEQSLLRFSSITLPKSPNLWVILLSAPQDSGEDVEDRNREKHSHCSSRTLETAMWKHISFWFVDELDIASLPVNPSTCPADSTPKSSLFLLPFHPHYFISSSGHHHPAWTNACLLLRFKFQCLLHSNVNLIMLLLCPQPFRGSRSLGNICSSPHGVRDPLRSGCWPLPQPHFPSWP